MAQGSRGLDSFARHCIITTSQEMGVDLLQRGPRIIEEMGSVSKSSVYLGYNRMTSVLNKHLFANDQKGHMAVRNN